MNGLPGGQGSAYFWRFWRRRDAGATKKMAGFFHRPEACATKARPTKCRLSADR